MQGIDDALKIAGNDSMKDLFSFCELQCEMADPNRDFLGWVEAYRTVADVGLAIYGYALNKERICRE